MGRFAVALATVVTFAGCDLNKQVEPESKREGMQTTQKIEERSTSETKSVAPPAGASLSTVTGATDFVIETTAKLQIEQAVQQYRALNGHYPRSHEEFMDEVIKKGDIHLPEPPAGKKYEYDVEKHELVVVNK